MSDDDKYEFCPECHNKTVKETASYHKIRDGVYRGKLVVEITWICKVCGWSTWKKEES